MAAVLSNNMNDIKQVTFFMEECRRMGVKVLGPDINESYYKFNVNDQKAIRFGMGAVKGVGRGAVQTIIEKRKDGEYKSIFDFAKRINLRLANKTTFENLILAGAFDSFNLNRSQYFNIDNDGYTFIEKAIKYGGKYQESENSAQISMFANKSNDAYTNLNIPDCEEWINLEKLRKEREVVGIYLSSHPLEEYKREIENFTSADLSILEDLNSLKNKDFYIGGIINEVEHLFTKNGNGYAVFSFEDFNDQYQFRIFGEDYLKYKHFLRESEILRIRLSVREGWVNKETGRPGEPRIQFLNFELLNGIIESNAKKITVKLDLNKLEDQDIKLLKKNLSKHKGKNPLYFDIYDSDKEIKLSLISEKTKVSIGRDLLKMLDEDKFLYKLN